MIKLWEKNVPGYNSDFGAAEPSITPYIIQSEKPRGAVLVCPGGGYVMKADHEGEPVALWLNSIGLSAFVLDYRVAPYKHPYPMLDAQRAIRVIRYNAAKWNIDKDKIAILGFSAGGHLASTVGTHFDSGDAASCDPVERMSSRPDAMVLCYPVITLGDYRHDSSMRYLIGEKPNYELRDYLSSEKQVTGKTPPAFIWHTSNDEYVYVENSLLFAGALSRCNVEFEMHVFPEGQHGLGLAENNPGVSAWPSLCEKWFSGIGFLG